MRLFACGQCGNAVFFENSACVKCGARLGYFPDRRSMIVLVEDGDTWASLREPRRRFHACGNAETVGCNWVIPDEDSHEFCIACRHNRITPDLPIEDNVRAWRRIEAAKRHLFYSLTLWRLYLPTRRQNPHSGLAFDFLAGDLDSYGDVARVTTGHDNGVITLDVAEADDVVREARRQAMQEPYRTLLGHFRHEIGHFFWDRLVRDAGRLNLFRAAFGDERADYASALQDHYYFGARTDWPQTYISAYASAHPWEDFAETWAHYMHMIDTLETARAFRLTIAPPGDDSALSSSIDFDPYRSADFAPIVPEFVAITVAVNALNRSLGMPDIYPFVLTEAVARKLTFIHELIHPPV